MEQATTIGWMSERFAREPRMSSLGHYLNPARLGEADDGDALIATFGMMNGLTVEDIEPEDGAG